MYLMTANQGTFSLHFLYRVSDVCSPTINKTPVISSDVVEVPHPRPLLNTNFYQLNNL